jgi:NIMA (never in mitosis gene a)-related kinase
MVTLRHAFDANSMKGLVLKILRGNYPPIPSTYSNELKEIIADMLIKDPVKRPSMRKILEKDFLSKRISKLLTTTTRNKKKTIFGSNLMTILSLWSTLRKF